MNAALIALPDCIPLDHIVRIILKLIEILVAGAFGGLANGIAILFAGGRSEKDGVVTWASALGVPTKRFLQGQASIGAGGAFAAVFGMLTIGNAVRADATSDITDFPIYLAALCVVGGFVGNKLLSGAGKSLLDRVDALGDKTTEAVGKATEAIATAGESMELVANVDQKATHAFSDASLANAKADRSLDIVFQMDKVLLDISSGKNIDQELEDALESGKQPSDELRSRAVEVHKRLSEYSQELPRARALAIVLANLSFDLGYSDEAFAVLENFLKARRDAAMPEDDDDATAYFNEACYYALLSRRIEATTGKATLLDGAAEALGRALAIAQKMGPQKLTLWRTKAEKDTDLESLRATPRFHALLDRFSAKAEASQPVSTFPSKAS